MVYLLRHGIAIEREDPDCPPDPERALTEKGLRRTVDAVRGLAVMGVDASRLWSSPYVRAVQTAEIARTGLRLDVELEQFEDIEPCGAVATTARRLYSSPATPVLIAGHAPHLDELLYALTGAHTKMKKAGCACVDLDERRLVWLMEPRPLRRLGSARGAC